MKTTATDLNKHSGKYINHAIKEPVIIERSGHPVAVLVSYERFIQLEDAYWGELALEADKEKTIGSKKTMEFLNGNE